MNVCTDCNLTFKSKKCLQAHYRTKKHIERDSIERKHKCVCGKSYIHRQGLYTHKQSCIVSKRVSSFSPTQAVILETENKKHEKEIQNMKSQIDQLKEQVALLLERGPPNTNTTHNTTNNNDNSTNTTQVSSSLNERVKVLEIASGIMKKTGNPILPSQSRSKITPSLRLEIKERQNHTCGMCKKQLSDIFQLDHTVALQFGGTNDPDNLMALCCECHATKSIRENKYKHKIRSAILKILDVGIETNDPQ